ncbi:MAG: hypothetical protein VX681_15590 [Myxococcota bacterium]|nr:hypothetical protein [Myxococcota bacterium]
MSARKHQTPDPTGLSLDALQGRGERLGQWIGENPMPILGVLGAILAVALGLGVISSSQESGAVEAANALAVAQRAYREAMGSDPGSIDIIEPANPEAARTARETSAAQFEAVIQEHAGSPTAALAALDLGELQVELGRPEQAMTSWEAAASQAKGPLEGLLLQRIAAESEALGNLAEAAAAYARASEIESFPLRYHALAESARLRAAAGEPEAAVALLQQLEADAPAYVLPDHVAARLRELRAAQSD